MLPMRLCGHLLTPALGNDALTNPKHVDGIKTRNRPSQDKMTTANEHELTSRGTVSVHALSREGQVFTPELEDEDVDMPIIAVIDLSKEDTEQRRYGGGVRAGQQWCRSQVAIHQGSMHLFEVAVL